MKTGELIFLWIFLGIVINFILRAGSPEKYAYNLWLILFWPLLVIPVVLVSTLLAFCYYVTGTLDLFERIRFQIYHLYFIVRNRKEIKELALKLPKDGGDYE